MKYIPITKGKRTMVDDVDFNYLSQFKWHHAGKGYAARRNRGGKDNHLIYMHRELTNAPEGMVVDHINQNKLDNRKVNLRVVENWVNLHNHSRKVGAAYHKAARKWESYVSIRGGKKHLGLYPTKKEAMKVSLAYLTRELLKLTK